MEATRLCVGGSSRSREVPDEESKASDGGRRGALARRRTRTAWVSGEVVDGSIVDWAEVDPGGEDGASMGPSKRTATALAADAVDVVDADVGGVDGLVRRAESRRPRDDG